jgi:hypothetical protein
MPFSIEQVASLLGRSPPKTLYHYTTQDGLLGIVRAGELWATNVQYMNDTREFFLALELAAERVKAHRWAPEHSVNRLSADIIQRLEQIKIAPVCAVSFCVNPDLLSQWRGYAGSTGGICLGFSSEALVNSAASISGALLATCIYRTKEQEKLIDEIIGLALEDVHRLKNHNDETIATAAANFIRVLLSCGALFKDEGFQEEAEWRLIISRDNLTKYEYRTGKSTLTPYLKFRLRGECWSNEIHRAIVGPCPHPGEAVEAVEGLLIKHGILSDVSSSKIPYRNW